MKWFYIGLSILSLHASAQSFLGQMKAISEKVSENEIDNHLSSQREEGIPGEFIAQMLPHSDPENELCSEPQESKDTRYEIVLIASGASPIGKEEILEKQLPVFASEFYQKKSPQFLEEGLFTEESVSEMAGRYWTTPGVKTEGQIDYTSAKGQEFFVESLIQGAAHSGLNESEMIGRMTSIIEKHYQTEEEKLNLLSAISSRFYRTYNDARNPGKNNEKYNPDGVALPESNISFVDMIKAAGSFDEFSSGVCNDITETVAKIGEKLFPDKDILAINAGSHFGLAVADGKTTRIIDGPSNINYQNELNLKPKELSPSNLRISKVKDGVLREIAVTDTKMGQLTEAAFETGKHLLKTDADISSLVAHYKKKNYGVSVGTSQFDDSNVLVVVAKYQSSSDKWAKNIGVGFSGQDFRHSDTKTKYQVHMRAGLERRVFQYVNERTKLSYHVGGRMSGMYTLNSEKSEGPNLVDFSAALDVTNRISMENSSRDDSLKVKSYVEVENTLGVRNWGAMNGILSQKDTSKFLPLLKNTSLHLNQINADVMVTKKLDEKKTLVGNAHYQGSNIGQKVDIMAGLNITAPEGAEILVFTGYTNADIKGFETQTSLIASPSGINTGVKYKKKNLEVSGGVRGIASDTPMVNGTLKINLGKKRR